MMPYWLEYAFYLVWKYFKKGLRTLLTRCDGSD
jgi:hypothetical protein